MTILFFPFKPNHIKYSGAFKFTPELYAKRAAVIRQKGMTFLKDNNENGVMSIMTPRMKKEVNDLLTEKNIFDICFDNTQTKKIHKIIARIYNRFQKGNTDFYQKVEESNLLKFVKNKISNADAIDANVVD